MKTRLPKGMTMEQLRKIRREDALKQKSYHTPRYCGTCGAERPCRHTNYEGPDRLPIPS